MQKKRSFCLEGFFGVRDLDAVEVGSGRQIRRRHVIRPVGGGEQPSRISKLRDFDGLEPERELDF